MEINKITDGNAVMLSLSGKLDASAAVALSAAVEEVAEDRDLVMDLEGLEYVSSMGLREIVRASLKMSAKGSFSMINVPAQAADALRMTGLYEKLNVLS